MTDDSSQRRTIHIRIRDLRRERSLTQEELAVALGLSRQSINAMEAGRNLPSLPVAMQIASFFSVPVHAIFDLTERSAAEDSEEADVSWLPLRDAFRDMANEHAAWAPAETPPVNLRVLADTVEVDIIIPGYDKDEIQIEVGDNFLTVASAVDDEDGSYFHQEFGRGNFSRTIALPAVVRGDEAEATLRNGILHISIPKIIEEKPKTARIAIKSDE